MDLVSGAVGSIIRKLGELLLAEYKLLAGLPEQIESLKNELESAHTALLTVAEVPPEQLNPQVRLWAREVREASYDMEDILDTFLVDGAPADGLGKGRRLLNKMGKLFRKSKERHAIAGALEKIKGRLQEVADRRDRYAIPVAAPAPASKPDPRLVYMHREAAQLVGIDRTKPELMAMLLGLPSSRCPEDDVDVSASGGDKMKIVSVVGAGGLGKTTLAKAVYDELRPRYGHGAFVSVGRKPDLVQVFTSIFFRLDERKYEAIREVKDLQLLTDGLRTFLQDKSMQSGLLQSLGGLHKLQTLIMWGRTDEAAQDSWDTAALPRRLRILSLYNLCFHRLPSFVDPARLPNLSRLELFVGHLDEAGLRALGGLPELTYLTLWTPYWLESSCKATVADVVAVDGFFLKLRSLKLYGGMVQLVPSEDSTSVSFSIWKKKEDIVAFGSKTKGECSRRVTPTTPIIMPDLIHLEFHVHIRALYKNRNGSCCAVLGWECLPSLHKIKVDVLSCVGDYDDDVKKAEAEMRQAAKLHPNQPIIEIEQVKMPYYRSTYTESDDDNNLPAQEKAASKDVQVNAGPPL